MTYAVSHTYQLGGEGGWDYVIPDPARHRLFIARQNRVMVVDERTGKLRGEIKGILAVSHEELVSSDFRGDSHSSIVDAPMTIMLGAQRAKVVSWYDNEWGFSCRMVDLITYMADRL